MLIMQLNHLRTLVAIQNAGSFSAAANLVNLSHSAVSIQMNQLEHQSGLTLFEKGRRPAKFTSTGRQFLIKALEVLEKVDELTLIGKEDDSTGSVSIGFVPTTLSTILPVVLADLRRRYPDLRVNVKSGLSGDLIQDVAKQFLDVAFLTEPNRQHGNLVSTLVASEPLVVISQLGVPIPRNPLDLLLTQPFIAFSRKSWLGRQIETHLVRSGVPFEPTIELDSIDAVENLVAMGHGVSVVPKRILAPVHPKLDYTNAPGEPAPCRRLSLLSHKNCTRKSLRATIVKVLNHSADSVDAR